MKTWDATALRNTRLALLCGVAFYFCVAANANANSMPAQKSTTIKPGKIFEKCMVINAAQKLDYEFDSSAKVDFNLHYHKGEAIYYPVKADKTTGETGVYESQVREEFCLMWENKTSTDVLLNYRYKVGK